MLIKRRVFGVDVLVVEADEALEPQDVAVPVGPVVHLPELDVADDVVDAQDADVLAGHVALDVARKERAVVVVLRDERVQRLAVGVDRRAADAAVPVGDVVRLDGGRGAPAHRLLERAVRIVHLEGDVADAVAVHADVVGRGVIGGQRRGEDEPRTALTHRIGRQLAAARLESCVREIREPERQPVEEGRLPGVADPELDVMNLPQFQRVILHALSITPTHDDVPVCAWTAGVRGSRVAEVPGFRGSEVRGSEVPDVPSTGAHRS